MDITIGQNIKTLRKKRGITQEGLASALNVSSQAVSKWENGIGLPDITLLPALAGFFGVSTDELLGYNEAEITEDVLRIARESAAYREKDREEGIRIIEEGLKKYPGNDILLENYLYLIDYVREPERVTEIALKLIDSTEQCSIRYDALRFLAYAYKAKGDDAGARAALGQIPELYFTRLSETAYLFSGEEKMLAAQKQKGNSLELLVEMMSRIAECFLDDGKPDRAAREYADALRVLDVLHADTPYWESYRSFFERKLAECGGLENRDKG